jgi:hypothetical protein
MTGRTADDARPKAARAFEHPATGVVASGAEEGGTQRISKLCRSSAAPPRSRKKSSPATSACSLTRKSTKTMLPASNTMLDEKLELALLRISMSDSAGQCSPEFLSCGRKAVTAGSTGIGVGVDSTLSDHGSHGGREHSRLT